MTDVKISALPAASALTGAELVPVVQSGTTSKSTAADFASLVTFASISPLTTKGDVLGFSTVNARIPVGSDGQVLTADSAQALGLKWASVTSGVSSVANSDSTLTISPTTGAVVASLNLAHANIWTGMQTINLNASSAPSPATGAVLQIVGVDANVARVEADSFGNIATFTARRANGTGASPTALLSADQIGSFNFHGYYVTGGPGYSSVQANLSCYATQNWTSTNQGTKVIIKTTPNNSTTLTDALTVDQNGSATVAGAISASNLSGTNTGDQTITLTGGVTGSGTGSFAATVITNANLTGVITSVGNATSIASQTGTGSTFVVSASPTITGTLTAATITMTGVLTNSQNAASSAPAVSITGTTFSGTGTTSTPLVYINAGSAPTTFSTSGTQFGINAASGFIGNLLDCHINGGGSVFSVASTGAIVSASSIQANAGFKTGYAGAASTAVITATGALFTGGTGTTTFPQWFATASGATAVTDWSTSGTIWGANQASGFAGRFLDFRVNGGATVFNVSSAGAIACAAINCTSINSNARYTNSTSTVAPIDLTGALATGTGTTAFAQITAQHTGTAVTTWSTAGTYYGVNADSGWTGNFLDFYVNGGSSVFNLSSAGIMTFGEGGGIAVGTTTGSKIATSTSQKLGFWNATPLVQQTTASAAATFVSNTSLIANDTATWDGYTVGQVVKVLRNLGILA